MSYMCPNCGGLISDSPCPLCGAVHETPDDSFSKMADNGFHKPDGDGSSSKKVVIIAPIILLIIIFVIGYLVVRALGIPIFGTSFSDEKKINPKKEVYRDVAWEMHKDLWHSGFDKMIRNTIDRVPKWKRVSALGEYPITCEVRAASDSKDINETILFRATQDTAYDEIKLQFISGKISIGNHGLEEVSFVSFGSSTAGIIGGKWGELWQSGALNQDGTVPAKFLKDDVEAYQLGNAAAIIIITPIRRAGGEEWMIQRTFDLSTILTNCKFEL